MEHIQTGLLKSGPHGGREGHGALAICATGIAIAFDSMLGRLGSKRTFPWNAVRMFDATDDSYRLASFGFGSEVGVVVFISDRRWGGYPPGAPFHGPRNDIADSVRPHLPSDGWDGPFMWSIHRVTKTKDDLAHFVLRFLTTGSEHPPVPIVPAGHVALRCVEVLGRDEASALLRALELPSVEDRVAALDALASIQDGEFLLVWFRALAGRVEEGLTFEPTAMEDARGQLVAGLRENLG